MVILHTAENILMETCRDLCYLYKRELTLKELQKHIMIPCKNKKAFTFPISSKCRVMDIQKTKNPNCQNNNNKNTKRSWW